MSQQSCEGDAAGVGGVPAVVALHAVSSPAKVAVLLRVAVVCGTLDFFSAFLFVILDSDFRAVAFAFVSRPPLAVAGDSDIAAAVF